MASSSDPPPQPPPHGQSPRPPGGLPDGNYDIFIIPPHSAGSGFLYLPSLRPHRNSFLAGVACALLSVGIYALVAPVLKTWLSSVLAGGGIGMLLLLVGVGVAGWVWGKAQGEDDKDSGPHSGGAAGASQRQQYAAGPRPDTQPGATPESARGPASGWDKAKEETRKREEARKQAEEFKRKHDGAQKMRDETERAAKAKAEKEKWEQARAREKDQREREARERMARERREKDGAPAGRTSPSKPGASKYEKPTVRSYNGTDDAYSFRPYDSPPKRPTYKSSASSISGVSDSSFAPSQTTARTTPPPSHRGPYTTSDPDKIQIKAVYLFTDSFPTKPVSSLVANTGSVTDGLILRIKTEGLFIDDDVRGVPQREWDVKAWTLKLVEDGHVRTPQGLDLHVLRATNRDVENKRFCFVLDEKEGFKVAIGLGKLRKGSQVRSLGMNGMKEPEIRGLLTTLGWM